MDSRYQRPTGTRDVLPPASEQLHEVQDRALKVARLFGYALVDTPILEQSAVFMKVGETSDIVQKERYQFQDAGGDDLTLRPEGTAGMARAIVENGLYNEPMPLKLCYTGPMFRREKPQANRYRQFTQFGIELYGADTPESDAEVIDVAVSLVSELGLENPMVRLNSIGCAVCRPNFRQALLNYYRPLKENLCDDCQRRMDQNPLRMLDCKVDVVYKEKAPTPVDYLCQDCSDHFVRLRELLTAWEIRVEIDKFLVRGLDYYTRTVFELWHDTLGYGIALLAGGRYDGLLGQFQGPDLPAVGFAVGLERLVAAIEMPVRPQKIVYVAHAPNFQQQSLAFARELRKRGLAAQGDLMQRSLKAQLRDAAKRSEIVIIVGREWEEGQVVVKILESGEQNTVSIPQAIQAIEGS